MNPTFVEKMVIYVQGCRLSDVSILEDVVSWELFIDFLAFSWVWKAF